MVHTACTCTPIVTLSCMRTTLPRPKPLPLACKRSQNHTAGHTMRCQPPLAPPLPLPTTTCPPNLEVPAPRSLPFLPSCPPAHLAPQSHNLPITLAGLLFLAGDAFYRAESAQGRDLAVLAAAVYKKSVGRLRVLDVMAGCGVRSARCACILCVCVCVCVCGVCECGVCVVCV